MRQRNSYSTQAAARPAAPYSVSSSQIAQDGEPFVWTRGSRWLTAIVFVSLALTNVTPILDSVGPALQVVAVCAAIFDPFAAFLYVAASQVAPDSPNIPLTLAQLFVVAWLAILPFNRRALANLQAIGRGLRYMGLFIVIWLIIGFINQTFDEGLTYALITAAILATYVPQARGDYRLLFWMLVLGNLLAILGHWGTTLGLPMEGIVYEQSGRGGERIGSGRLDVNFASVSVGFALWTAVSLLLPTAWLSKSSRASRPIWLAVSVIVLCAVPLIVMGARGGLAYLVLGFMAVAIYALSVKALATAAARHALAASLIIIIFLPVLYMVLPETTLASRLQATLEYNKTQSEETGSSVAAGRSDIWSHALKVAMDYPLTGAPKGAVVDFGEYGVFAVGGPVEEGAGAGAATHNMLLDLTVSRGFPAMIIFLVAFIRPLIALSKYRGAVYAMPFIIAHFTTMLAMMNLSCLTWKTYWALHVLTSIAAARSPQSIFRNQSGLYWENKR